MGGRGVARITDEEGLDRARAPLKTMAGGVARPPEGDRWRSAICAAADLDQLTEIIG